MIPPSARSRPLRLLPPALLLAAGCGVGGDEDFSDEPDAAEDGAGVDGEEPEDAGHPDREDAGEHGSDTSDVGDAVDSGDAGDGGEEPPPPGPVAYLAGERHSPITAELADGLRARAGGGVQDDVFAKVGASATVSRSFLHCFSGDDVDLDGRDHLWPTIEHFRNGDADGTSPFTRQSLTATVGWSAGAAVDGDPSPLEEEIAAISPAFAVIMYGTNDIGFRNPDRYGDRMLTVVDTLLDHGVIPLVTTIMPRDDSASADAEVPIYNALARAVAQARQVPLVDYHGELAPLPDHGLGGDGIHPTTYRPGGVSRACVLDEEGLRHGYNLRNLVTIEALDRLRRVVVEGEEAPDEGAPAMLGDGSPDDPFVVVELPFVDARDTTASPWRRLHEYTGCDAPQDESGPEWLYRLDLDEPAHVQALVSDRGSTDVDLHLLDIGGGEEDCLVRAHKRLEADLDPGIYWLVADTYVKQGEERGGEYLLAVVAEPL